MTGFGVDRGSAASQSADPGSVIAESLIDAKGDLIAGTAANTANRLAVGANETRLVADSAELTGLKYVADTVNYAVAAKGDLLPGTAADTVARLPVGANNTILAADSAEASGMKWGNGTSVLGLGTAAFQPTTTFWSTGDVKITLKTAADTGWVLMNDGTIGNAASGGTTRANADTEDLFTLLWTNVADAQCAVSGGRGASAAADFAADKTIALPKALGRALAAYGAGSGLTDRALAFITGAETHTLTEAEMPSHFHTITANVGNAVGSGGDFPDGNNLAPQVLPASDSKGGDEPHENMQPTVFLNLMIKL
jgi:hypothetical protein